MQTYTGTKTLDAKPMSLGDYNDYQGWTIPEDQDPLTQGYLVEYQDGGKANHPDHEGYISWSPKDVFERTYNEVPESYQQRVIDEQNELSEKLGRLVDFMHSETYTSLNAVNQGLLMVQQAAMTAYSDALKRRIELFE